MPLVRIANHNLYCSFEHASVHSLPQPSLYNAPHILPRMASTSIVEDKNNVLESSPWFNRLLNSTLGSPFVTTSGLPPYEPRVMKRFDPNMDFEQVDGALVSVPLTETVTRPPSPTPSFASDAFSLINWPENAERFATQPRPSISDATPTCSFLPSGRSTAYPYYSSPAAFNSTRIAHSNSFKNSRNFNPLPRLWEVLRESSPGKKCKRRLDVTSSDFWNELGGSGYIDWANLPPLDGEEGELIDDEACVIDVRAVTGFGESHPLHVPHFDLLHWLMGHKFLTSALCLLWPHPFLNDSVVPSLSS